MTTRLHIAAAQGTTAEAFSALTDILWRERTVLERLLYALTVQRLVLTSADTRWLAIADEHVVAAAEQVQTHEIARAMEADLVLLQCGLSSDGTLRELAEHAPEPWSSVLTDHRETLATLMREVESAVAENRRLLQSGERATREALAQLSTYRGPSARTYDARGDVVSRRASFILDERA